MDVVSLGKLIKSCMYNMCIFIRNEAFQVAVVVKNLPANVGDIRDMGSVPGLRRSPVGGQGNPVPLPGEFHGQRSLVGYSPWGCKEFNMTEQLIHNTTHNRVR